MDYTNVTYPGPWGLTLASSPPSIAVGGFLGAVITVVLPAVVGIAALRYRRQLLVAVSPELSSIILSRQEAVDVANSPGTVLVVQPFGKGGAPDTGGTRPLLSDSERYSGSRDASDSDVGATSMQAPRHRAAPTAACVRGYRIGSKMLTVSLSGTRKGTYHGDNGHARSDPDAHFLGGTWELFAFVSAWRALCTLTTAIMAALYYQVPDKRTGDMFIVNATSLAKTWAVYKTLMAANSYPGIVARTLAGKRAPTSALRTFASSRSAAWRIVRAATMLAWSAVLWSSLWFGFLGGSVYGGGAAAVVVTQLCCGLLVHDMVIAAERSASDSR